MIDQFSELKKAVQEFKDKYPSLLIDNAFVGWYLHSFVTGDDKEAFSAIVGGPNDKGVDAIYIDKETKSVCILQGKYNQSSRPTSVLRPDVLDLAQLGRAILLEDSASFKMWTEKANIEVQDSLKEARKYIQRNQYRLILLFITTGQISNTHLQQAERLIEDWPSASYQGMSRIDLLRLMKDYIEGVAPPVPSLNIPIQGEELFSKFDDNTDISSWVFTVNGKDLGNLFNDVGIRIFSRNIRGFLGDTSINSEISNTLRDEPQYFWYFNNGVTIICDKARQINERGKKVLCVSNAQIINGQQTTRMLASFDGSNNAALLIKVIVVTREGEESHRHYTKLVNEIVRATNHQNAISVSDLMSNEIEQIRIERDFRKYNYQYLRKKQTKKESRLAAGRKYNYAIKKEELAQRIAACHFEPRILRLGKDRLFEEDKYYKIFDRKPINEYLVYYWLARNIFKFTYTIRRGYAKWLVLNFIWSRVGSEIMKLYNKDKYRVMSERSYRQDYRKILTPFDYAIDKIFVAAMAFYRDNKIGERGSELDESSFFKTPNLDKKFKEFIDKNKQYKKYINNKFDKFIELFEKLEIN